MVGPVERHDSVMDGRNAHDNSNSMDWMEGLDGRSDRQGSAGYQHGPQKDVML